MRRRGNPLRSIRTIHIVDTPFVSEDLVKDIFSNFKERALGPSGLTRIMLYQA